ncbi:hypothetical protein [Neobacillus driksii]|uniref:hypothetical protein n=1 Tax=Neobacillus driksii TaxID=3035913 RepID=UPI0035BC67E0
MIPEIKLNISSPKSETVICSMAIGAKHVNMLKIMGQTLSHYAHLHQMDHFLLELIDQRLDDSRPPAWDKIIFLNHMLQFYDTVIWVDCDAIICNPEPDIRDSLIGEYPMYLVYQEWGNIPNTGVWVLKRKRKTKKILNKIWENTKFLNHVWWEQSALMDLMGYTFKTDNPQPHDVKFNPTKYCKYIGPLDRKWNSCCCKITDETIIKHYCGNRNDSVVDKLKADYDTFTRKMDNR